MSDLIRCWLEFMKQRTTDSVRIRIPMKNSAFISWSHFKLQIVCAVLMFEWFLTWEMSHQTGQDRSCHVTSQLWFIFRNNIWELNQKPRYFLLSQESVKTNVVRAASFYFVTPHRNLIGLICYKYLRDIFAADIATHGYLRHPLIWANYVHLQWRCSCL